MRPIYTWIKFGLSAVGLASVIGAGSALFLLLFEQVLLFHSAHGAWLWALPLVLVGTRWAYREVGRNCEGGLTQLGHAIRTGAPSLPVLFGPLVFTFSLLSQMVGAVSGREGAAVQWAGWLGARILNRIKLNNDYKRQLLCAATAAGFGSAFGVPSAGAVFALELFRPAGQVWLQLPLNLFCSYTALAVANVLGARHMRFPQVEFVWTLKLGLWLFLISIAAAFAAMFYQLTHAWLRRLIRSDRPGGGWRSMLGSIALLAFLLFVVRFGYGGNRIDGLGLGLIDDAFRTRLGLENALMKTVLTALTLAIGFKGGEMTPLVAVGASLGAALQLGFSAWSPPLHLLPALGMVAVFAAAAHLPLTCALMAAEFFGWPCLGPALIVCLFSSWLNRRPGIYGEFK